MNLNFCLQQKHQVLEYVDYLKDHIAGKWINKTIVRVSAKEILNYQRRYVQFALFLKHLKTSIYIT